MFLKSNFNYLIYFRANDRLKNNVIEAFCRKGAAVCQLYYYNYVYTKKMDENELKIIDDIWVQTSRFVSPDSDSKVCSNIELI